MLRWELKITAPQSEDEDARPFISAEERQQQPRDR
jgi:hypothetical protein